jgi:hypothetical protein
LAHVRLLRAADRLLDVAEQLRTARDELYAMVAPQMAGEALDKKGVRHER